MSVFQELESTVNQIYEIAEEIANFAIPALSEDAVDAILNGDEVYSEDSLPIPEGVSEASSHTAFSASEQNRIALDNRIKAIKRIIKNISDAIDNTDEFISLTNYRRLVDRLDRGNGFVRYAAYVINQELLNNEISREHHLRFETLRTGYQSLLKELNECVSRYNLRHRFNQLHPEFSTDVSPIKGTI
jgi:hypothetical protein